MALLLDDFGLLSVLLRGARLVAQSLTLGGIVFMAVLILRRSCRLLGWSAAALALAGLLRLRRPAAAVVS